eukprot:TRINITY_DN5348_c0_g1_i1.p1 TRINITY_DN5348_c0_g1~~TRINITY_DN5348_c0_g1_i1.p1  ORF type:complete len:402 (-),score=54.69 TRINITY_DN5348_c0_g1_i1:312-1517(-)
MPQRPVAHNSSSHEATFSELLHSSELRLLATQLREYIPISLANILKEIDDSDLRIKAQSAEEAVSVHTTANAADDSAAVLSAGATLGIGAAKPAEIGAAAPATARAIITAVPVTSPADSTPAAGRSTVAATSTKATAIIEGAATSTAETGEATGCPAGGSSAVSVKAASAVTGAESPNRDLSSQSMTAGPLTRVKAVRNAAVLVPLFFSAARQGEVRVWLTKRASKLSSHSGEVSLPGGKRDAADIDDEATALREAHEEIGLKPAEVVVVARLEPFLSKHLLTVTPVVGLLAHGNSFQPQVNPSEVEAAFSAPLAMFLKEQSSHRITDTSWMDLPYRIHHFDYDSEDGQGRFNVWGLTAAMLIRTASVVFRRKPEFGEFHPDAPSYEEVMKQLAMRRLLNV